ncbi:MAG TPA: xanthine dehydrogenase family protein subunit M [Chthoniobacteraceae bacterium]|jgi:xanthine dehydrogenase YagS FAD-binding subunit
MRPFAFTRAPDAASAVHTVADDHDAAFLGGGTNLIDLMKLEVEKPTRLVDINRLPLEKIEQTPDGLRIGALARNSDTAEHPLVREHYPLLSQALLAGASPQLRNMATVGGNLLQRTRCFYFYDTAMPCNKREPGSGCGAQQGFNRVHAIFGASQHCVAVHPSDMCVALAAYEAAVNVEGSKGARRIPMSEFHRLPGDTPERDTNLEHGQLITSVDLPRSSFGRHVYYLKIRDRASYAFALVSAAVGLDFDGEKIRGARIALGGVAHKPWRALDAEQKLTGRPANEQSFMAAADAATQDAQPLEYNRFKIEMVRRAVLSALRIAAAGGTAV